MTEPPPVIDPSQLSGYLTSKGWRREGNWRGAGVWELESTGRLLIPDHREYADDDELIQEAICRLATYEDRPEPELLLDIAEPMVDSLFFRTHPATPAGTTPLPSGIRALGAVHDLLSTAARAAEDGPRLLFEGRRSALVDGFLRRVILGAARPGSYVLTVRVPAVAPTQPQLELWKGPEPSTRRMALPGRDVLQEMYGAVLAARAAAELVIERQTAVGGERLDIFDDQAERGVSANLCKALGNLGGHSRDRPFEIGFTWARGLREQGQPDPIEFTGSMAAILARAGDELERLARSGRAQIIGQVETLNKRAGEDPRIKIVGEFRSDGGERAQRALWVIVSVSQYDQAIEAQRAGRTIEAAGRLVTSRRRLELRPDHFEVHRR